MYIFTAYHTGAQLITRALPRYSMKIEFIIKSCEVFVSPFFLCFVAPWKKIDVSARW